MRWWIGVSISPSFVEHERVLDVSRAQKKKLLELYLVFYCSGCVNEAQGLFELVYICLCLASNWSLNDGIFS